MHACFLNQETIYIPEEKKVEERLILPEKQKEVIRQITLGIDEVDESIRAMAVEDVVSTLENGHPLNRVFTNEDGEVIGYIACEDFVPHEVYVKYFGTTGQTGRNLLREIPAFLDYTKQKGYTKITFHGWNGRLNHILERYGFKRIRTDSMAGFSADFYEKPLVEEKPRENIEKDW